MEVIFITPMYNASSHLTDLIESLKEQRNKNWKHIIIDDMSTDNSFEVAKKLTKGDNRFEVIKNSEKKWALKNVVDASRKYQNKPDVIIANLDGDDALCNENTVDILIDAYSDPEVDTAWTSHTWDINGMNISKDLPDNVNPYHYPWCTSHLKTWRATTLLGIGDENFKDLDGNWFVRGYDQALYLPLLYLSHKRRFINEVCYLYRINSKSIEVRDWNESKQIQTINLVRARGYV